MSATPHINDIAPELLGRLFEFRLEQVQDDGTTLLELASVCKYWKDVAYRHPRLWATLHPKFVFAPKPGVGYDLQDLTEGFVAHLGQWFARAGNLPLTLDVTFRPEPTDAFFAFLLDCPGWKSLRLHDNNAGFEWTWLRALVEAGKLKCEAQERRPCWPALTSLLVGTPLCTTIGQRTAFGFAIANVHLLAPNLQALTFGVSAMNTPTAISGFTNFSWNNLTSFAFLGMDEDRNPTFIYHILTQAKNLRNLTLKLPRSSVRGAPPSTVTIRPAPTLPITHKKLRHLTLGLSEALLKTITSNVRLPAMHSLQLITPSMTERTGHPPLWFFPLLHRISYASPLFWPTLEEFAFGPSDSPLTLTEGDGNFDAFKDDPAAWWARRVGYE